ncbi:MAG: murein biosynthesis integral membrane protein MurJ, partial [Actinomycetota bacterium]|nr:murein biosynthesis integral membrane protein MurJ [Actinomycetota bacterium]
MTGRRGGVAGAAALLTVLAAASAVLGLARDVVIAAVFGAGAELDAYLVAQGLMNLVLALAAGAMAKAGVPVVSRSIAEGDGDGAHHSALVALSITTLVLAVGSIVMWLAAGTVVDALAPGFDAEQEQLARTLTRIVLVATVLIAGTNLLAGIAQAHRRFFWSGVQGIPFNVVMIVAAAVFGPRYGVRALAVGFVAGSGARLLAQFVPLRAIGLRLVPTLDVRDPGFRRIARLLPPLLLGSAIGNVNTLVDRAVGSGAGEGTIAALNYGWRVAALAEMLLIAPLITALYPALGAATAPGELARLVQRGTATMATILAPLVALLVVAREPIIALVFGRGDFDGDDVERTATALVWYAPAVVALGWREVASRAFYAVGDARSPMLVALGAMALNVLGDVTLGVRLGVPGLAASTTASLAFAAAMTTIVLA